MIAKPSDCLIIIIPHPFGEIIPNITQTGKQVKQMTLEELAAMPGNSVGTKIAAEFLGTSQWGLSLAAKQGTLGLPYVFSGNRLKISKAALLEYCGWKGEAAVNG